MKHRVFSQFILGLTGTVLAASHVQAATICTAMADAKTGAVLLQEGNCIDRVTPASTFKIALSLMGYDAGVLKDQHQPTLPYRQGYVDWGGEAWRQETDPSRWMQYGVLWYSQQITQALGAERFQKYTRALGYGNADVSGDKGKENSLERSWISSSLKISPLEQLGFLRKLVNYQLPVSRQAMQETQRLTRLADVGGWQVHGKTGTAFPRQADGSFDEAHGYGWFVGWASKGERSIVFARLVQDEQKSLPSAGLRTRDAMLKALPALLEQAQK
ncbi:class D beta-lactamase [Janthinobacterium lividum]|uniref:Beta-lactamase n=1 Tax=Janthinobacterium lividum TaxID=29581 RepID=A0A1E8PKH5_9BURK|nr:class D beta-lactamase [Janthinobacterium lividum]